MTDARPRRVQLDSLTSLRWFAASAVFYRHSGLKWGLGVQGPTGVSFFFILSGFVLAWSASATKPAAPGRFYRNRFARIYPAHVVGIVFSAICFTAIVGNPMDWGPSFFNLTLLHAWIPSSRWWLGGNGVSWSLADEAFFYATFPFVFRWLTKQSVRRIATVMAVLVVLGEAVPLIVRPTPSAHARYWFTYAFPPVRIIEFLIGVGAAILVSRRAMPKVPIYPAIALAVAAYVAAGQVPYSARYVATTLVPFALLIVAAAQSDVAGRTPALLRSKALITLGKWSFAFYLLHQSVLGASRSVDFLKEHFFLRVGLGYLVATVLAGLLFTFVEAPFERRIKGFSRARTKPVGATPP